MKLAINGGKPTFSREKMNTLWPIWDNEELTALRRILKSHKWCRIKESNWNDGEVGIFEKEFRNYIDSKHFIAVANGTVAIELALLAVGLQAGDEILVPASTFFGTVTPVLRIGAVPIFVDIDSSTFLVDPDCLESRITPRTRAVIVVHLCGLPVDIDRIVTICQSYSLHLIEDCAQAFGSTWRNRYVGTFGSVGCFSFQQDKALNAGEGGGMITQDASIASKLYAFHNGFYMNGAPPQKKHEVSTNARITPWQAAILRCQLNRVDAQINRRLQNAQYLFSLLEHDDPITPVKIGDKITRWSIYGVPFKYDQEKVGGISRDYFLNILRSEGIPAFEGHFDPVYRRPLFIENQLVFKNDGCPIAEHVASHESLVISQRFFLGPHSWMKRLVEVIRLIQVKAPQLKELNKA